MIQRRDRAGLAIEPLAQIRIRSDVRGQDFNGDRAIKPRVPGFVDLAHSAGPQGRLDLVRAEACTGRKSHERFLDQLEGRL